MKKYLVTIAFLLVISPVLYAQETNRDSLKIESLKKLLPQLKDTARINCLNQIAELFDDGPRAVPPPIRYDSIAFAEANAIGYKKGMAAALVLITNFDIDRNRTFFRQAGADQTNKIIKLEKDLQQAIAWASQVNDYRTLSSAHAALAQLHFFKREKEQGIASYKKAIAYAEQSGDILLERSFNAWLADSYTEWTSAEAFEYYKKCVILARKAKPDNDHGEWLTIYAFYNMGLLNKLFGDYETALTYYREAASYAKKYNSDWTMEAEIGNLYYELKNYDSSLFYLRPYVQLIWNRLPYEAKQTQIRVFIMEKKFDEALSLSKQLIDTFTLKKRWFKLGEALNIAGLASMELKDYKNALKYSMQAFRMRSPSSHNFDNMRAYKRLSDIFHQLGNNDSAFHYLSAYTLLRDSIMETQFHHKLRDFRSQAEIDQKEARLSLLNKDNLIKAQQLKQEASYKKFLMMSLFGLLLTGIAISWLLIIRRRNEKLKREAAEKELQVRQLENDKEHSEFQQRAAELEMQALRAQMNPHFIFNCLSSINKYIVKNETEAASDYLTRFSRLIRMVLINSRKSLITLEDELEMLRLYLDMERLRFNNSFDYNIILRNDLNTDALYIPPLLLQPFCENSIWHGLMHKEGHGVLNITITRQENCLGFTITDNGIGRKKASEYHSKSAEKDKSLGLQITTERLELLNRMSDVQTSYCIEDLYDDQENAKGTKVQIQINHKTTASRSLIETA